MALKILNLLSIFTLALVALIVLTIAMPSGPVPNFAEFKIKFKSSERLILDRNGKPLHELRFNTKVRRFDWLELDQISPTLVNSVVFAEDQRFFQHHGVDYRALAAAFWQRLRGSPRGASTITMQVTDFLDSLSGKSKIHRGYWEKIRQIRRARQLEKTWTKEQILEAYLNLIQFKGELQGIAATSYGLFEKNPLSLTEDEAAVLTVLIRSPNANHERIFSRACGLIKKLNSQSQCTDLLSAAATSVEKKNYSIRPMAQDAPHIAKLVMATKVFNEQSEIRTTLDSHLQNVVINALRRQILALKSQNMNDGAAVVMDNKTGEILAYVGNIGKESSAVYVDGARALRQAGSTLKPFLYGLAFDRKLLSPASILDDSPLEISVSSGLYRPQNYDRGFRSFVTVRNSLASSMNIPAVKTVEMVGVNEFVGKLSDLGFTDLERPDFYGPSIALGSADVKLIQLVNAYRSLANKGLWSESKFLLTPQSAPPKRVFSEGAAFLVSDILSDREARSSAFGLENMLSTRFWTAVKTGTSKDMRDNWCVGYSDRYTVGVWSGNFSGSSMWSVSGIQGAAPVWLEIMNALHETEPSSAPLAPKEIVKKNIHFAAWKTWKQENFIRGTEPQNPEIVFEKKAHVKIAYPLEASLIAIDPDIPLKNQKVFFNFENPQPGTRIVLNNKDMGPISEGFFLWRPRLGRYNLKVKDDSGATLDQVHFEVRGRDFVLNN